MGFFDRILNRGNRGRSASESRPASDTVSPSRSRREPGVVCEMETGGRKYILRAFELDIDKQAASGSRPVVMKAVFDGRLDNSLESWIMRDSTRRDGTIKFFRNNDAMAEGAMYSLSFHGAVCTGYEKKIEGTMPVTTLRLQARHINISGEEYLVR